MLLDWSTSYSLVPAYPQSIGLLLNWLSESEVALLVLPRSDSRRLPVKDDSL
ncbi:hypothetical protein PtB15_13B26 [Puccinia triticina]|nr:hypothetical protein PtB15_13B26 [Puccinia triticina]